MFSTTCFGRHYGHLQCGVIITRIRITNVDSRCRLCKQYEETIDHLTSGYPILAKNEYLMMHDKVCTYLRYSVCKALKRETNGKHTRLSQCMNRKMLHCWESSSTHRHRSYSKWTCIIKNKKEKTCILIEEAIPMDRKVFQ